LFFTFSNVYRALESSTNNKWPSRDDHTSTSHKAHPEEMAELAATDAEKAHGGEGVPLPTLAVVGTAGRRYDGKKLTAQTFARMTQVAIAHILQEFPSGVNLVSGGAAWADHVAVELYLQAQQRDDLNIPSLTVYLPCQWDAKAECPRDSSRSPHATASTMVSYHATFSKHIGRNSVKELARASEFGAVIDETGGGFHARNTRVARACTHLLAFTFASGDAPSTDSGTFDTWAKCGKHCDKWHVQLPEFRITNTSASLTKPSAALTVPKAAAALT